MLEYGSLPALEPRMAQFRTIVSDVDAAVAFYTGQLGFTLVKQFGAAIGIVEKDDMTLWLAGPLASASRPMPDGAQPVPGGWNRIALTVDDLDGTVARLRSNGVLIPE